MSKLTFSPPNGILFVFDPTNKSVIVPTYVNEEISAFSESCVSIGTQASVDGETEVSLEFGDDATEGLQPTFRGSITAPGGKVAVITSDFQKVLELDVPRGEIGLSIWVDDLQNPARIVVAVEGGAIA